MSFIAHFDAATGSVVIAREDLVEVARFDKQSAASFADEVAAAARGEDTGYSDLLN